MNIIIKTIPHKEQRYETSGDWLFDKNGDLFIFVSETGDWRHEILIGIHEAMEAALCKHRGISEEDVSAYDIDFERSRKNLPHTLGNQEPGDQDDAPYQKEHFFATNIERLFAAELDVNWKEYDTEVDNL